MRRVAFSHDGRMPARRRVQHRPRTAGGVKRVTGVSGLVRGILSPPSIDTASLRRKADDDSPAPVAGLSNRQPHVSKKKQSKKQSLFGATRAGVVVVVLDTTDDERRERRDPGRRRGEGRGREHSCALTSYLGATRAATRDPPPRARSVHHRLHLSVKTHAVTGDDGFTAA